MFMRLYSAFNDCVYVLDTHDGVVERWSSSDLTSLCRRRNIVIEGFNTKKYFPINLPRKVTLDGGENLILSVEMDMTLGAESYVDITYVVLSKDGSGTTPYVARFNMLSEATDLSKYHFGKYKGTPSKLYCVSDEEDIIGGGESIYGFEYNGCIHFNHNLPYDISVDLAGGNLLLGDFIMKIARNGTIEV